MISEKKRKELYGLVSNGFVDARIKIVKLEPSNLSKEDVLRRVDHILYGAMLSTSQKAVDLFKTK